MVINLSVVYRGIMYEAKIITNPALHSLISDNPDITDYINDMFGSAIKITLDKDKDNETKASH